MVLQSLRLQQFRSYSDATFEFAPGVNVIVGPNGTGKTNLLEAVYAVATGGSFRVGDKQLLQYGAHWFRVDAEFDNQQRSLRYSTEQSPPKKLYVNGTIKKRLTAETRLPVVLFEPDTLRMLMGSPARRREYLDALISQWFPDGAGTLRRYERVLLQRNNLLKRAHDITPQALEDQLFAWDMSLAELASEIETIRSTIIARLNATIADEYSRIAKKTQPVAIRYSVSHPPTQSTLLHALEAHRRLDITRGFTTIGPHRSDFSIELNGQPADTTASRGEQRSLVLALKRIELKKLRDLMAKDPLVLLDDVMSELDKIRQTQLLEQLETSQVVLTTTALDTVQKIKPHFIKLA